MLFLVPLIYPPPLSWAYIKGFVRNLAQPCQNFCVPDMFHIIFVSGTFSRGNWAILGGYKGIWGIFFLVFQMFHMFSSYSPLFFIFIFLVSTQTYLEQNQKKCLNQDIWGSYMFFRGWRKMFQIILVSGTTTYVHWQCEQSETIKKVITLWECLEKCSRYVPHMYHIPTSAL